MWRARFFQAIPKVIEAYPKHRWVFLTLTVRNCPLDELKATLGLMNKAWNRMILRKQFPAIGFVKSTEVTRSANGDAHPHFHVLMLVSSSYFGGQYIKQDEWRALWQQALRADYLPVVNVKAVKPRQGEPTNGVAIALLETLKYGVKESDLMHEAGWLSELTKQLHKTRAVSVGGVLKDYLSEEEPEDLVHVEGNEPTEAETEVSVWFGWREMAKRYVKTD
jgi:plasmid rolling circle replication initiator protein Rep